MLSQLPNLSPFVATARCYRSLERDAISTLNLSLLLSSLRALQVMLLQLLIGDCCSLPLHELIVFVGVSYQWL